MQLDISFPCLYCSFFGIYNIYSVYFPSTTSFQFELYLVSPPSGSLLSCLWTWTGVLPLSLIRLGVLICSLSFNSFVWKYSVYASGFVNRLWGPEGQTSSHFVPQFLVPAWQSALLSKYMLNWNYQFQAFVSLSRLLGLFEINSGF